MERKKEEKKGIPRKERKEEKQKQVKKKVINN